MIAFFVTIYARLLVRRREELFSSGDGLEGDDFFFAIIISGARARAEEYAPHRFYSSFNDTKFVSARTAPSSRRGGALDASFATRRPKTYFDVNEKRIIFFFALVFRDDILSRGGGWPQKRKSTQITHRNILLFLKRYREQRNVSNRPPSLPPLSLLPPSSPRKPRTRRKTSSRKSRRANRFWSTSRGGLF